VRTAPVEAAGVLPGDAVGGHVEMREVRRFPGMGPVRKTFLGDRIRPEFPDGNGNVEPGAGGECGPAVRYFLDRFIGTGETDPDEMSSARCPADDEDAPAGEVRRAGVRSVHLVDRYRISMSRKPGGEGPGNRLLLAGQVILSGSSQEVTGLRADGTGVDDERVDPS
jgi:hypothetical protein